jgi:hypothetical protein
VNDADESRSAEEFTTLRDGLLYWFYDRRHRKRARLFADLLDSLLQDLTDQSIFSEECRSLIAEVRGELPKAIRHREREIELIRRVQQLAAGTRDEEYIMRLHGYDDLSDRIDLLATLYHEAGKTKRAIALLEESRAICDAHGLPFDGDDLYEEYRREVTRSRPSRKRAVVANVK